MFFLLLVLFFLRVFVFKCWGLHLIFSFLAVVIYETLEVLVNKCHSLRALGHLLRPSEWCLGWFCGLRVKNFLRKCFDCLRA